MQQAGVLCRRARAFHVPNVAEPDDGDHGQNTSLNLVEVPDNWLRWVPKETKRGDEGVLVNAMI